MTPMLLSMGAIVSDGTPDTIQNALAAIKTSEVWEWFEERFGTSLQAQRIFAFKREQKPNPN